MSEHPPDPGAWTGAKGTRYPVDVAGDRRWRPVLTLLAGGQVVWIAHFMVVYLVAEAACTGFGPGLDAFDPPLMGVVVVATTVLAAGACAVIAYRAHRLCRDLRDDDAEVGRPVAFTAFLLAVLSLLAILSVGFPVLVFPGC